MWQTEGNKEKPAFCFSDMSFSIRSEACVAVPILITLFILLIGVLTQSGLFYVGKVDFICRKAFMLHFGIYSGIDVI